MFYMVALAPLFSALSAVQEYFWEKLATPPPQKKLWYIPYYLQKLK